MTAAVHIRRMSTHDSTAAEEPIGHASLFTADGAPVVTTLNEEDTDAITRMQDAEATPALPYPAAA